MDSSFDPKDFRHALGMFATGVTIVTTCAPDGSPIGITANSFNSVSLDPPLVLWSLARNAKSQPAFSAAQHWNVHILANHQHALSSRFARAGTDKFADLALDEGRDGTPLLRGCSARFQCRTLFQYDGGDHVIFVGQVIAYDRSERPPLLYVTGDYALAVRMAGAIATEAGADPANPADIAEVAANHPYSEDMLGYLLGRGHYQFMAGFRRVLARQDLSDTEFFVLSLLAVRAPLSAGDIAQHMAYTGCDAGAAMLAGLCARDLLAAEPAARYRLTGSGRAAILQVLAAARQTEAELAERLGPIETAALRNLLKRLVAASDPGLPMLWPAP